jgi:hypothetical protein
MLRVHAGDKSNLETILQHLTNDITVVTEQNRALEKRNADLESRLAERKASPDGIDKKNQDT